ncbi:uncharacterized protein LOC100826502 isoform X4 [Brachypodium distachyon]|uniref:uncharacterized protein LOC100826502 isoform X4 n=1 Tax=Brachypodium distachyon TaxID=15368 RepID=UPI000D0DFE00|nr:uncharacterized protein LOC100826502 isoform X4 [Brachypodium distachyon]|eukprot:XP_024312535.1 uncharacterized protein LOC100826502 isoform X4 [Brachypodium distachyon]
MESSAAGGERPQRSGGGASSPPPPPPPPSGWLAGLVSGAGRLLAAVLGPDSPSVSASASGSVASDDGSASSSPSSFRPRSEGYYSGTDHNYFLPFSPENNQLNQTEKETVLKDYAEASLAIVSDIEPKDAIAQLLMQETFSRSECSTLIKIIQERVVNPDSGGTVDGELALAISQKAGRQPTIGYSSFSPNVSTPSSSSLPIHGHGFDNSAGAGAVPTLTPAIPDLLQHNADKIQSDTPDNLRRIRPKINGDTINIAKFKQVDVVRNRPASLGRDDTKHAPFLGTNNVEHTNIVSKVERAEEILDVPKKPLAVPSQHVDSSSLLAGGDQKTFDSAFLNPCSTKDLKNSLPLKVEPLDSFIPFEQKMMDLSHQKHEHAACDDSCSVSKLMFMADIGAAPSLPMQVQLQNDSKNRRRRQPNSPRTAPKPTGSPAKGTRRKNIDAVVKSEIDSLEQRMPVLAEEQDPDYVPEKRPVGRPRKGR